MDKNQVESFYEKVRRAQRYLCENCKHEKCLTSCCPFENMTDEELLKLADSL